MNRDEVIAHVKANAETARQRKLALQRERYAQLTDEQRKQLYAKRKANHEHRWARMTEAEREEVRKRDRERHRNYRTACVTPGCTNLCYDARCLECEKKARRERAIARCREVLALRAEGLQVWEIADRMGRTKASVQGTIRYARVAGLGIPPPPARSHAWEPALQRAHATTRTRMRLRRSERMADRIEAARRAMNNGG
jgi:hypothetical protein